MVQYINNTYQSTIPTPLEHFGVIDSGNNKHHCFTDAVFFPTGFKWTKLRITGAHGAQLVRVGRGTAQFLTRCTDGTYKQWSCPDSLFNPHSPVNLLCMDLFHHSYPDYAPTGHNVNFVTCSISLRNGKSCSFHQNPHSRLFLMELFPRVTHSHTSDPVVALFKRTQLRTLSTSSAIRRLAYPNEKYFNLTKLHGMLGGIEKLPNAPAGPASQRDDAWYAGKLTQRTIQQHHARRPACPGSDIYSDIVGPFPVPTREGHYYCSVFKDAFNQTVDCYLMVTKDQLLDTWKQYIADTRTIRLIN